MDSHSLPGSSNEDKHGWYMCMYWPPNYNFSEHEYWGELQPLRLTKLQVYVNGSNLLTFSKGDSRRDPEHSGQTKISMVGICVCTGHRIITSLNMNTGANRTALNRNMLWYSAMDVYKEAIPSYLWDFPEGNIKAQPNTLKDVKAATNVSESDNSLPGSSNEDKHGWYMCMYWPKEAIPSYLWDFPEGNIKAQPNTLNTWTADAPIQSGIYLQFCQT